MFNRLQLLQGGQPRRLAAFQTGFQQLGQFSEEAAEEVVEGDQTRLEIGEGSFLKAFPELVEAELLMLTVPQFSVDLTMQGVDDDGGYQFAVELTQHAILFSGPTVMNAENGFELFKDQFDLPAETVKGADFWGR